MAGEEHDPHPPRRSPRDPVRGDLIGGHRIERPLGAGAMGTVWLAEHVTLGRRVALKILADGLAHDVSFQDRFMREARLAARLDHPNVVTVYDAGTDPAGLWLSMRYVEGEDLRRRLNRVAAAAGRPRDGIAPPAGPSTLSPSPFRRPSASDTGSTVASGSGPTAPPGGLPPEEAVRVVEGVAAGLDHAHSRGILHRDVKPGNVLLESGTGAATPAPPSGARTASPRSGGVHLPPFRDVLLADFGLTKELEEGTDLTQTGMLLGSADSVAPEQIEGRETDGRVDVYALASLLYVTLTGVAPFPGATMAKLFAHVNGDRPRVSSSFPALRAFDAVIAQGMAKDPAGRPSTAGELAALAREAVGRLDVDPQETVAFPAPDGEDDAPTRVRSRPSGRDGGVVGRNAAAGALFGGAALGAAATGGPDDGPSGGGALRGDEGDDARPAPRPRPTPPATGPLAPRMREEQPPEPGPRTRAPAAGPESRTRVAPAAGGRSEYDTPVPTNRAAASRAAARPPVGPPLATSGGPGGSGGRGAAGGPVGPDGRPTGRPPWLVPALVVGTLAIALIVVLAVGLSGGGSPEATSTREADGTSTRRTTESTTDEPATDPGTTPETTATPPPETTTGDAPPSDADIEVRGGGIIASGAATRDPVPGQPIAGTGTPADYVSVDGTWRTLVARPGAGWKKPRRIERGSALERMRQEGPEGRLILVDHTPSQPAGFDTSGVTETRTITGTRFGDKPGYRFMDNRIGSIPECARLWCVDVPLNQTDQGPGWGVLVAAPTPEEAWATVERVARATGP